MPLPRALEAYSDCEDHFNKALASTKGIAITLPSAGMATSLRQRLNTFREMLRRQARSAFPDKEDPRHGRSPFDALQVIKDPDNPCRVLIRKYSTPVLSVEPLV